MPPILDAAIGTVFVFLLFSLVISTLNEVILSFFDQRAKFLHMGLLELFGEGQELPQTRWERIRNFISGGLVGIPRLGNFSGRLSGHGLINAFSRSDRGAGTSPSYIPSGAFVTALIDLLPAFSIENIAEKLKSVSKNQPDGNPVKTTALAKAAASLESFLPATSAGNNRITGIKNRLEAARGDADALLGIAEEIKGILRESAGNLHTAKNVSAWIDNLPDGKLKESLRSLFTAADGDVTKFKTAVEGWFNAAMDRVSGWYKRYAQSWMIVMGFLLAAILNVDTIRIVRVLSENPNLAKAVASQAETFASENRRPMTAQELTAEHETRKTAISDAKGELQKARIKIPADPEAIQAAEEILESAEAAADPHKDFRTAAARLGKTGLPIGWNQESREKPGLGNWSKLAALAAGWLLTAAAASLGAPFWFDVLNRFVNVRNAGRPPGEKDATSTPTKPLPATLDKPPK
jgi:hypothetical protein